MHAIYYLDSEIGCFQSKISIMLLMLFQGFDWLKFKKEKLVLMIDVLG